MSLNKTALLVGAAALIAAAPAGAGSTATITISHQMRGCHEWQLGTGAPKPTLGMTLKAGTVLRFVNDDVMPHKLVQQGGPKLTLSHPNMKRMGASTAVKFGRTGVYRFTTKAGEDYPWMHSMKTIGKDYILHLTVRVK
jgi:plastocyanin